MTIEARSALFPVKAIAECAGKAAFELYRSQDAWVERKTDGSSLTQADMASEVVIWAGLQQLDPSTSYLSKESASSFYTERKSWERFCLVDPLDGTKEFMKRNNRFILGLLPDTYALPLRLP